MEHQPSIATPTLDAVSTLTLQLNHFRNLRGVVNVVLFSSAAGFPSDADQACRAGCFVVSDSPLLVSFADLPFGRYAAAVHHDETQDGQISVNALGIPKEGIGFSNNPKILIGAPSFKKTAFDFTTVDQTIAITMKYLLR